jgi:hypothetical protein
VSVDLRTRYLGLELHSPIVASASPLNGDPATARLVERAGAGAIVLPSLFEGDRAATIDRDVAGSPAVGRRASDRQAVTGDRSVSAIWRAHARI